MGIISNIFNLLISLTDDNSYIEDAKDWGDSIWRNISNKKHGILSLYQVNGRLYKSMKINFYNKSIVIFTDEENGGLLNIDYKLSHSQKKQLNKQGSIFIKNTI